MSGQPQSRTGWSQPAQPPAQSRGAGGNGLAVGALVLGILAILFGLVLGWIPLLGIVFTVLAIVLGIVGVILGVLGRGRSSGTGVATAGIITSAIGGLAAIGWIVAWVVGLGGMAEDFEEGLEDLPDEVEIEEELELDA